MFIAPFFHSEGAPSAPPRPPPKSEGRGGGDASFWHPWEQTIAKTSSSAMAIKM